MSSMSASENFLKYFLEKRKNMKHFLNLKFHFFSEFIRDINYQFSENLIFFVLFFIFF